MAIEGLDATLLIENAGFVVLVEVPSPPEPETELTLDSALKQAKEAKSGDTARPDGRLDPDTKREATLLDLWVGAAGTPYTYLDIAGSRAVAGLFVDISEAILLDPNAPEDNAVVLRELSSAEKKLVAGGIGTTDDYWGDEEGEYEEEIVVTGPEQDDNWDPWDDDPVDQPENDSDPDGDGGGQGGPDEDAQENPYAARITIDPSVPPEHRERAEQVREKLAAELRDVGEKINSLNDNQIYKYGGREVTGAELKAEFAKIGFNITWNEDYGPKGNGENDNGIVSANLEFLEGIVAQRYDWGDWGPNWLILHELAHLLGVVEQFERDMWQAYLDSLEPGEVPNRDDWQGTEWFRNHEAMTEWFAYLLGQELGLPTGPYPPAGYDPSLAGSGDNGNPGSGPGTNMPEN